MMIMIMEYKKDEERKRKEERRKQQQRHIPSLYAQVQHKKNMNGYQCQFTLQIFAD